MESLFLFLGAQPLQAEAWANSVFTNVINLCMVAIVFGLYQLATQCVDKMNKNYDIKYVQRDPTANAIVSGAQILGSAIFWGLAILAIFG